MDIDHIGIAVRDLHSAIEQWEHMFGYEQVTEIVLNTRQKVYVVFLEKENSLTIKLIQPSDETSTVWNFIRKGGSLHHLCFKTDDLSDTIIDLKDRGLRMIVEPQPGEAFENNMIAFFYGKNNLNIEVIDTEKRAQRLDKKEPQ